MARSSPTKAPKPAFSSSEAEVEWYETHDSWDDDDEEVELEVRVPLDRVIPVRLSADKWGALHREARELGVGPTTLARMWLLEKLRAIEAARPGKQQVADDKVEYGTKSVRKGGSGSPPTKARTARRRTS